MNTRNRSRSIIASLLLAGLSLTAATVDRQALMDESKVPPFTVPDLMVLSNGQKVTSTNSWTNHRRPELLELFKTEVYGHTPKGEWPVRATLEESSTNAIGGIAWRKQIVLDVTGEAQGPRVHVLIYGPNTVTAGGKVPAFLGLNFGGNQTVHSDPGILVFAQPRKDKSGAVAVEKRGEESRGTDANSWQVEQILKAGYAIVTAWYGDIEPDFDGSKEKFGVRQFIGKNDDWGALGVWAWGMSRMLDYAQTESAIDPHRVVVIGHSRLGKAAVWAGAQDQRFAAVISNNSGCGGAALSKRIFGETVEVINTNFPHWFTRNFRKYNGREADLPIDQHELLALIAPRPLYVASAEKDLWADPKGEFLSAKFAEPVFTLFGKKGLGVDQIPEVNHPVGGTLRYHVRTGGHAVTGYDWTQYIQFANEELIGLK